MATNALPAISAQNPKEDNKIDIEVKHNLVKIDNIHEMTTEILGKIDLLGLQD